MVSVRINRSGLMLRTIRRTSHVSVKALFSRTISSCPKMSEVEQPKEIQIPIPHGHIAGKVWNEGGIPILGLHGYMDNAGTWDGVGPLLPKDVSLVAIDFLGHGLSSKYPVGSMSHIMGLVLVIERVVQHFGWEEVNLLGHSMGAGAGMLYAGTFPEKVKKLLMIDLVKPISIPPSYQPERSAKGIKELLAAEAKLNTAPPSYEYESIVEKLVSSYGFSITEKAAKTLLKRGSTKSPDGRISFNYDPRLKCSNIMGMTFEQQKEYAEKIQCELMVLKATTGPMYENRDLYDEILNVYEKNAKKFIYKKVEGTHHVHLNHPELVAPDVIQFFSDETNHT